MTSPKILAARSTTELLDEIPPLAKEGLVVPFEYGGELRVLVNDPAAIHRFMAIPLHTEGGLHAVNARVMGQGLLVNNVLETWRPRRLLIQRELSPARVQVHEAGIIERTSAVIEGWQPGARVAVRDEIGHLALTNLGDAVFGGEFGDFGWTVKAALECLVEAAGNLDAGIEDPELEARLEGYILKLEAGVADLIGHRADSAEVGDHVIDVLIRASQSGDHVFADPFVRDESVTLMMAGHDTTAFLIAMAIFLLSGDPEARERVAAEAGVARRVGVPASEFALALPYVKQVVSETLRLYPPLPFYSRTADEDVVVDGYTITAGTPVAIAPWVTHRDARYFPDPLRFDPDRFSPERKGDIPRNAYLPFGLGQRVCAGSHFAMLETAIVTGLVATDVDLEFETDTPGIDSPVTLRLKDPLYARVCALR